jgi:hypothetical protein
MGGGFGGNYGMDMGTGGGFMGGEMETKSSEKKVIYFGPACVIGVTNGACRPVLENGRPSVAHPHHH